MSSDRPVVSVLMPSRNHVRFVAAAVESICLQTYRPIELIIVDDGSVDGTLATLKVHEADWRARLHRLVIVANRRQRGIPRTLNRALNAARGEFVAILASDDLYLTEGIQTLVTKPCWDDERLAVAFGDASFIDEAGTPIALDDSDGAAAVTEPGADVTALPHYLRWRSLPEPEPLGSYASLLRGSYVPATAAMIRRKALVEAGGWDRRYVMEDYPLWLKLSKASPLEFIDEVITEKRIHGKNTASIAARAIYRDLLAILVREDGNCSDAATMQLRSDAFQRALLGALYHGRRSDVLKAVRAKPFRAVRDLVNAWAEARAALPERSNRSPVR